MAYAPPFVYSKVTGIKSPTGVEAEGWLISVGGTPKEIMSHSPEFTYRRLLDAARMAKSLGAQIMGLGAFTKVVGDAGLTVSKRAPLPITTGNSYSASGALWAAHDAVLRLGLVPTPKRGQKVQFKAMVVGATGAIGSVCARMLAMVAEEVYLVSPETAKLLSLKESILKETPDAKLFLSSRADKDIADMDMIVTATSGAGKKVLDIMKVKPGCVITDVARPLDLPPEEVAKRPDVLVIESGEIQLAGRRVDEEHRPAEERRLRLPRRNHRARARRALRELHRRPQHRMGEGARDLPARPQARHEARRNFRGQRAVLRRGHSPRAQAGARRASEARDTGAEDGHREANRRRAAESRPDRHRSR